MNIKKHGFFYLNMQQYLHDMLHPMLPIEKILERGRKLNNGFFSIGSLAIQETFP